MASAPIDTILELGDPSFPNFKIKDYQYREFYQSNGNKTDSIANKLVTFSVPGEQQLCYVLSDTYLLLEGQLQVQTAVGGNFAAPARTLAAGFVNNAGAWVFSSMRIRLGAEEIESYSLKEGPGSVSTLMGHLTYPNDYNRTEGPATGWKKDEASSFDDLYTGSSAYVNPSASAATSSNIGFAYRRGLSNFLSDNAGTFSISLPLSRLSGFCADMNKILYNIPFTLEMTRVGGSDFDAIMTGASGAAANTNYITSRGVAGAANEELWNAFKINMSKMRLVVPCVILKESIQKALADVSSERAKKIRLNYRVRRYENMTLTNFNQGLKYTRTLPVQNTIDKVRWLIVAAQNTNKLNDYTGNPCTYNHCDIKNVTVLANGSKQYPTVARSSYPKDGKCSTAYLDFTQFRKQYLGLNEVTEPVGVTFPEWLMLYPIHVVDLQYNDEPLRITSKLDVSIEFNSQIPNANLATNITIHYLTICENTAELTSNGNGSPFTCSKGTFVYDGTDI